jgi:hypothetical protein
MKPIAAVRNLTVIDNFRAFDRNALRRGWLCPMTVLLSSSKARAPVLILLDPRRPEQDQAASVHQRASLRAVSCRKAGAEFMEIEKEKILDFGPIRR